MTLHSRNCRRSLVLLALLSAGACGGQSERQRDEDGGEAGDGGAASGRGGGSPRGGTGTGGRTGGTSAGGASVGGALSGGTSSGGTISIGGASGSASGGVSGTSSGGSSGSVTGGTSGSSGTGTCTPCTPTSGCSVVRPPTSTINDFENLLFAIEGRPNSGIFGANDASGMVKPEWWLEYFSGSYAYPEVRPECPGEVPPMYPLSYADVTGELRVTGTVGTFSGFGIWLGPCAVDMSGSAGISFRIGGEAGPEPLYFQVFTRSTLAPDLCSPDKGTCSAGMNCIAAGTEVTVPATPSVISLRWSAFGNGSPEPTLNPSEVVFLTWEFPFPHEAAPYAVDVTVDDVVLFD